MTRESVRFFSVVILAVMLLAVLTLSAERQVEERPVQDEGVARSLRIISRDVEYVSAGRAQVRDAAVAISTLNYVQSHISSTQYGYLSSTDPGSLPVSVEECLIQNAGICGNQVEAFMLLVTRLGLQARSVKFFWENRDGKAVSHIAAEVKFGGKWRYFDVTWGTFFVSRPETVDRTHGYDILAFDEVMALREPAKHRITNQSALSYWLQIQSGLDPFEYIKANKSILFGENGSVRLVPKREGTIVHYFPDNKPDFFGLYPDHSTGTFGMTSVVLGNLVNPTKVEIASSRSGCAKNGMIRLKGAKKAMEVPLPSRAGEIIEISSPEPAEEFTLETVPTDPRQPCYVVFTKIDVLSLPQAP
jgi:hypothetical protein